LKFIIPGEPIGKARPRVVNGGKHTYTPAKTKNYETLVKELFYYQYGQMLLEGPIEIDIKAYFKIPKSTSKKNRKAMLDGVLRPEKKPDIDNVVKAITDSLNDLAYLDDKQIVKAITEKFYSDHPRAVVEIKKVEAL